jgi:hypothetical protein
LRPSNFVGLDFSTATKGPSHVSYVLPNVDFFNVNNLLSGGNAPSLRGQAV